MFFLLIASRIDNDEYPNAPPTARKLISGIVTESPAYQSRVNAMLAGGCPHRTGSV
jgi:hypothetical protein